MGHHGAALRVAVVPGQLAAQHRGGLAPACGDARVDLAQVGFDQAATAFDARLRQQPRAARFQRLGRAGGDQRMVLRMHQHADLARALQHRVHRLRRGLGHVFGPGLDLGAHHAPRQHHRGLGHGLRHLLLQRVDLRAEGLQQRAQLRGHLRGEGLLEAVQRHQPVAVAVLVAGLARRGDLRLHGGRLGRRGAVRRRRRKARPGPARRSACAGSRRRRRRVPRAG